MTQDTQSFGFSGHAKRLINASRYSAQGFKSAYKNEAAFRLECWLSCFCLPIVFFAHLPASSRALMLISWLLVPLCELLNSALEAVVDRIGTERHELAGRAKDMGSAAVAVATLIFILVWGLCLFPLLG